VQEFSEGLEKSRKAQEDRPSNSLKDKCREAAIGS
jgi:hypothetical protein